MQKKHYELVSFKLCPYVQRSVIVLTEKNVEFKRTDISLSNKPAWFLQKSPTGKVPMLVVDDDLVLFESAVICEYIDETTEGSLFPGSPLLKAKQRSWIEFGSAILNQIAVLYSAETELAFNGAKAKLANSFARVEEEIVLPYFIGTRFQIVDAVFAPIFRYFDVFEKIVNLHILDEFPNLQEWRTGLRSRPSVVTAVSPDYSDALIDFVVSKNSYLGKLLKPGYGILQIK